MARDNRIYWIIGIIIALLIFGMYIQKKTDLFVISGSETITRSAPSTVNPSSTFTVTYTANSVSGNWGASVQDTITGGCTISGKAIMNFVMLSDLPNPLTYTVQAPSSGTCTFTGDYQFGTNAVKAIPQTTISVCVASCTRPTNKCTEASTVSNGCGGMCTGQWTVTKVTAADADCSNKIDRTELGNAINMWIAGTMTRADLGTAIQSWSS